MSLHYADEKLGVAVLEHLTRAAPMRERLALAREEVTACAIVAGESLPDHLRGPLRSVHARLEHVDAVSDTEAARIARAIVDLYLDVRHAYLRECAREGRASVV